MPMYYCQNPQCEESSWNPYEDNFCDKCDPNTIEPCYICGKDKPLTSLTEYQKPNGYICTECKQ